MMFDIDLSVHRSYGVCLNLLPCELRFSDERLYPSIRRFVRSCLYQNFPFLSDSPEFTERPPLVVCGGLVSGLVSKISKAAELCLVSQK